MRRVLKADVRFLFAPRLASFEYLGFYRYFLTICTWRRSRVFVDDELVGSVVAQLSQTAQAHWFSVFAYCLMPDHLHALVGNDHEAADFRNFVRVLKQRTSFDWKRQHSTSLWQRGYFDRVLRDEEDTFGVARYIIENPVRAKLARHVL